MINASIIFGRDEKDRTGLDRTREQWGDGGGKQELLNNNDNNFLKNER